MKPRNYRTALITGASSGIGKAFAYELAAEKVDLVLTARSEDQLRAITKDLQEKFEITAFYIVADLSESTASQAIVDQLKTLNIEIDLLVNNAGVGKWTRFLEENSLTYADMIQVNITSLVTLTRSLLPSMLNNKHGGIINIASTGALQPCPYIAVYCASKAFVLSFSEALYGEYQKKGITVTSICPGNTKTNFQIVANANTKGMRYETPENVVKESLKAWQKNRSNHIVGIGNYWQSFLPRILSRKAMIAVVEKVMRKKVNA